ncbi:hypothetical protein [Streptomyces sp. P9-A2]
MPSPYTSADSSTFVRPRACSGGMQRTVPMVIPLWDSVSLEV